MDQLRADGFPVAVVCEALQIRRSGYYAYRRRRPSQRQTQDEQLRPLIQSIFWKHRRRYGARRIHAELTAHRHHCGLKRVARLMKEMGLVAIQPRSFRPRTTQSRHTLGYSPNLLLDAPPPTHINQIWVADITYIPLKTASFAYLALLMDLFSRRIIGWELADHMRETLVLSSLRHAIKARQPAPGLIHHSDRGGQYAGEQYRNVLGRARAKQSMSRKDNCYDNAFIESCFGTIKTELETIVYDTVMTARSEIGQYIRYYDTQRRHSALGYLCPAEFERNALSRRPGCSNP